MAQLRLEATNKDLTDIRMQQIHISQYVDMDKVFKFNRLVKHIIFGLPGINYLSKSIGEDKYTEEEFQLAKDMHRAFKNDQFSSILSHAVRKRMTACKTLVHQGEQFELVMSCMWDGWMPSVNWGLCIKPTSAKNPREFAEQIKVYDYDRQRAWYMDIAGSDRDMIIGISKKNMSIFKVPIQRNDELYNAGKEKYVGLAYQFYCKHKPQLQLQG